MTTVTLKPATNRKKKAGTTMKTTTMPWMTADRMWTRKKEESMDGLEDITTKDNNAPHDGHDDRIVWLNHDDFFPHRPIVGVTIGPTLLRAYVSKLDRDSWLAAGSGIRQLVWKAQEAAKSAPKSEHPEIREYGRLKMTSAELCRGGRLEPNHFLFACLCYDSLCYHSSRRVYIYIYIYSKDRLRRRPCEFL
jgi:hypothetical protein